MKSMASFGPIFVRNIMPVIISAGLRAISVTSSLNPRYSFTAGNLVWALVGDQEAGAGARWLVELRKTQNAISTRSAAATLTKTFLNFVPLFTDGATSLIG
jgi:hypothetical protein